ncbi:MAG: VOC family protein [Actinomycetota bacterium]|jgi:catechol 2,3-dioxygenase-like lactoylglutathione lyase family enzyme|nr:VOC family protein [Actinomycetota bacterium]
MTQSAPAPSRIRSVRYVALGVPEFRGAADFYEHVWGLERQAESDGAVYFTAASSSEPCILRLRSCEEPRVDVVSLVAGSREDVEALASTVAGAGMRLVHEPAALSIPGDGYGFRFFDPDGRTVEVAAEVGRRAPDPVDPGLAVPLGISHVVLNTTDLARAVRFYVDVLGFHVSDYLANLMVFLRCGPAHHVLAFTAAPHVSLNHVAYDIADLDQYMHATGRTLRAGYELVWGPGRHGPGNNTFSYFEDPGRFVCEYTTGLRLIEDERTHKPKVFGLSREEEDLWGTAGPRRGEPFLGVPDCGLWSPPPF